MNDNKMILVCFVKTTRMHITRKSKVSTSVTRQSQLVSQVLRYMGKTGQCYYQRITS